MKSKQLLTYMLLVIICLIGNASEKEASIIVKNPYAGLEWKTCDYVQSMSHLHGKYVLEGLYQMGFRHFAISTYYPSKPVYPLPAKFMAAHPDIIVSPNAEHHSFTDTGIHSCALGSFYSTGYGSTVKKNELKTSPINVSFNKLNPFNPKTPWLGVYRLDLWISGTNSGDQKPIQAKLSVDGALECDKKTFEIVGSGNINERKFAQFRGDLYLRALNDTINVKLEFDEKTTRIDRLRLMQGVNRSFAKAIKAALDGDGKDAAGNPIEGLLFKDGGGMTINHPNSSIDKYLPLLDCDERVLGIEVWNHRRRFGKGAAMHYYKLWDDILKTGRRCFGFFVKDHYHFNGLGRNILLLPKKQFSSKKEKEHACLKAYRNGCFFGSLGVMAVNEKGECVNPYDYSEFCFRKIALEPKNNRNPFGISVVVGGNDRMKRPNIQIRFITDKGIAKIVNNNDGKASFEIPRNASGDITCKYIRVEAFAYPEKLQSGRQLNGDELATLNVDQICSLHNFKDRQDNPISVVDMIFSQPIMFQIKN